MRNEYVQEKVSKAFRTIDVEDEEEFIWGMLNKNKL